MLKLPMKLQFPLAALANLFLLLANFPWINSDLNSDGSALLEFATAVPHVQELNWDPANPLCTNWSGITCSMNRTRVVEVHLPGYGLHGPIPANTLGKLHALRVLSLRSNYLNGNLLSDILSIPSLQSLHLQHNNFSGSIPRPLSSQLSLIDLSFNSLTGDIPSSFANLKRLSVLKLQFNSFSGGVPNLDFPSLELLNVSYNLLNGSIPQSLQKFPVSSFIGNPHLCGPPLTYCSVSSPSPPENSSPPISSRQSIANVRKLNLGYIIAVAVGGTSLLILLVLAYICCCLKRKNGEPTSVIDVRASNDGKNENLKTEDFVQGSEIKKLVVFEGCSFSFDLKDLLKASAEVLGKGSLGSTYKAILDKATTVAVKRLRKATVGKQEFVQHMELVNRLGRHPNVVQLLAYYCSKNERLLVYEYVHARSLAATLHGNRCAGRTPLDWDSRLNISLGAARGIAHIHSEGAAKLTHGNIKSSNILLRCGLDGCVSDFGLSPITNYTRVKNQVAGYRAPELIVTQKASQKSDVYSFGVLLLEILTGKCPIQYSGCDDVIDLPRWVGSIVREEWSADVFDSELVKYQNIEEELVQMLQIALSCVAKVPDMRPTMDEVARMIDEIRHPELENRPSSEDNRSKDSNVTTS